jgi:predicted ATPase
MHQASDQQLAEINYWLGRGGLKTGYQVVVHRFRELPVDSPLLAYLDREMEFDDQLTLKEIVAALPVRTRVVLREEATELEVMPQDIGVGISQLFPVVVLTITRSSGLIAIEQPELHVHPAIQVELADLFARYAIEHDKLMLLETHSEHVMLRLLRRIREEPENDGSTRARQLQKDAVSVAYVQSSAEGTRFKRLRIDDKGDFLDEWPAGFFDERDQELFF